MSAPESWAELVEQLRGCQDFVENTIVGVEPEAAERAGLMHAGRLLGHVTDAMLIAVWIQGVGEAYERLVARGEAEP